MAVYERRPGVQVALMGDLWASFSAVSGETMLINDETAAVLELLDAGRLDEETVSSALAADSGQPLETVRCAILESWAKLTHAGMVRAVPESVTTTPDRAGKGAVAG